MDAKFLREMDNYIRNNIQDEEILVEEWLAYGVPDGSNMLELCHLANEPEAVADILESFARTILLDSKNH